MTIPYGYGAIEDARRMGKPIHGLLYRLMDDVGDGSGGKDMAGAADEYFITPPSNSVFLVDAVVISILDDGAIDINGWGGLAALATGCLFEIRNTPGDVLLDLTDGVTLKDHGQLAAMGRVDFASDATGCIVNVHIEFGGFPLKIDGERGESLVFETQDSLVGLDRQNVLITGLHCHRYP